MQASLHAYMKVGILHFMAFPETLQGDGPILETLAAIVEDPFFGVVEVSRINDPKVRREAAALLSSAGMEVVFGAQPVLLQGRHDLNSLDEAARAAALAACYEALAQAKELGARKLAILSGPDPGPAKRAAATDALIRSLIDLGRRCEAQGVQLALETFDFDIDKRALVGPNREAAAIARTVRQAVPSFGLMLDLSHLPLQYETPQDGLTATADVLIHTHCGNTIMRDRNHPLYGDQHPRFGHPDGENGVAELREYLRMLLKIGYLRPGELRTLSFEVKPAPGESSRAVIAGAKRTLMEAWATLEDPGSGT